MEVFLTVVIKMPSSVSTTSIRPDETHRTQPAFPDGFSTAYFTWFIMDLGWHRYSWFLIPASTIWIFALLASSF
jgi:hypothetical protein